jgi:hypothetical protein
MDFLKKAAAEFQSDSSNTNTNTNNQQNTNSGAPPVEGQQQQTSNTNQQDYADKGTTSPISHLISSTPTLTDPATPHNITDER